MSLEPSFPRHRPSRVPSPSRVAWAITLAVAAADVVGLAALGFSVPLERVALMCGVGGGMLLLAWIYTEKRPNPVIAAGARAAGFLVLFTMLLATMSYLGTSLALPLWDGRFAALDRALGFDWTAHLAFVAAHRWLELPLEVAYHSSLPQVAIVVVALTTSGRAERLGQFTLLFAVTATVIIVVSSITPAAGAYAWHQPASSLTTSLRDGAAGRWHLDDFFALRDGSLRTVPLGNLQGLVSFPSFHTALAIVTLWALRPVRRLTAPAYAMNGALILATLSIGGHYLVDVLGGAAVGIGAIAIVTRAYREPLRDSSLHARAEDEPAAEPLTRAA